MSEAVMGTILSRGAAVVCHTDPIDRQLTRTPEGVRVVTNESGAQRSSRQRPTALPLLVDPCMIATAPATLCPGRIRGSNAWTR